MVVCAWLAADHSTSSHRRHLLEPICREGRLPGIGTEADYRKWFSDANFEIENFEDLSARVRKTWSICLGRVLRNVFRRRDYTQFLFSAAARNRVFLMTMVRIWLAYILGAMRYGIFKARKL
jgi:tocopherol O-methyltransferase